MKPKIIFFGSSKYSVIDAKALNHAFGLEAIVTSPDKPKGRKKGLTAAPPKKFGRENNIPVLTVDEIKENLITKIKNLDPDFIVVADYGHILPGNLLQIPKYKALNVHHSLLPKYRGPTPAPSAILAGEQESGVTVIKMTQDVDAGPIYAQEKYRVKPDETTDSLLTRLNTIGGSLIVKVIKEIIAGKDNPKNQGASPTSYTERLTKQSGKIGIDNPPDPETLNRMIRAYFPWPTVWTEIESRSMNQESRKMKIKLLPPTILPFHQPNSPFLIQPEGKRPLTLREFRNGYPKIFEKIGDLLKETSS